jgi:PDZ domain-containing secreted protein
MKKVVIILLSVLIVSCSAYNKITTQKRKEMRQHYSVENNVVFYDKKPFAELQAMTWSLDNGELVKEMNFKLLDKTNITLIGGMIDYLSDRHQGDEIEVEFDVPHDSKEFKL